MVVVVMVTVFRTFLDGWTEPGNSESFITAFTNTVFQSMTGVIQYTEELFNTASCKHEKVTKTKFVPPLPSLSPRGQVRKAEDDGNPSRPKRFRAARKSMDEGEGFRPYKPPLPSPGEKHRSWKFDVAKQRKTTLLCSEIWFQ